MEAIKAIKIDKKDNVAVVLRKVEKGWGVVWTKDGETASVQAMDTIPMVPQDRGAGYSRRRACGKIRRAHRDRGDGISLPVPTCTSTTCATIGKRCKGGTLMEFWGYRRPDGKVGVRNKILILPASICATDTARIVASQVEGAVTFHNQNGCSQVAPAT